MSSTEKRAPAPVRGGLFGTVDVPDGLVEELRGLQERGTVVFVMRAAGWLNLAFVRFLLRLARLPALRAVVGLSGLRRLLAGPPARPAALRRAVEGRAPALVFLRRASAFRARGVAAIDPFPLLIELQRRAPGPVYLVPLLFVWSRRPSRLRPGVRDILFGSPEAPGTLTTAVAFLRGRGHSFARAGRPLDLGQLLRERPEESTAVLGRKLRGVLAYHLGREARAILGPPFKDFAHVRAEVLRDRGLRAAVAEVARSEGRSEEAIGSRAGDLVDEIAARMTPGVFLFLRPIVAWLLGRLYDGLEVEEAGFESIREAAARGAVVVCPSHKSHLDYVVMTYLFYTRGLLPPHVAAGENMNFLGFGRLARACGGFFIRRSFRGDRLYAATLRAYVKRLLRDGFPQEVFIEGGRSRTGKLLPPKTGILSMQVEAFLEGASEEVTFIPVAIDYERLAEGRAYVRELQGGVKRREDLRGLIGARKVLRRRHGRVFVRFGPPVALAALAAARGLAAGDEAARRAFVEHLAHRIAHGIAEAVTLTPVGLVAAAVLAWPGETLTTTEVAARVALLSRWAAATAPAGVGRADGRGADAVAAAQGVPGTDLVAADAVEATLAALHADGFLVAAPARPGAEAGPPAWTVAADRRSELDFHRNTVLHRFAAGAIVAAAVGAGCGEPEARARAQFLSRLFKREFPYRADRPFDAAFDETRDHLLAQAALARDGDALRPVPGAAHVFATFLLPYLEAYAAAASALAGWGGGSRQGLLRAAMERARGDHAKGSILCVEAVSRSTLDNAVAWLEGEGALVLLDGEVVRPDEAWRDGRAAELAAAIGAYRDVIGRAAASVRRA